MLTKGSVCSGAGTCELAFAPFGVRGVWFSEIHPAPSAVLTHHWPDIPNVGDMTQIPDLILSRAIPAPDILCGGTPCQSFSVSGRRLSLDDLRGNLCLTFCEIANAIDDIRRADGLPPCVVLWENVPGVLSTHDNAFGCFLGSLAGSGAPIPPRDGKWTDAGVVSGPRRRLAWRILDAQFCGLAQRRERVFVVASAGAVRAEEILFEPPCMRRDPPTRRGAREDLAGTLAGGARRGGGYSTDDIPLAVDITNNRFTGDIAGTIEAGQDRSNRGQGVLVFGGGQPRRDRVRPDTQRHQRADGF